MDPVFFIKGGFLCDEMGVGKTLQLIATSILHYLPHTLVVLPLPLLQQWKQQIQHLTGHTPLVYHGNNKKKISTKELTNAPIVLTTYHALLHQKGTIQHPLFSLSWSRIIFDEAHHLRNPTKLWAAAARIGKLSSIVWLVTGTPVQNKSEDLQRLCSILGVSLSGKEEPREQIKRILLKRTKAEVGIDIPPMSIHTVQLPWTNEEEKQLSETMHSLLQSASQFEKLKYYTLAKQVCILPSLVNLLDENIPTCYHSSKLDAVFLSMEEYAPSRSKGALVFCHFQKEMEWLHQKWTEKGYTAAIIDGSLSLTQRQTILSSKYDVLLLQIRIGCEGLNLQEHYSDIYFISPHWNPAVEAQSIARCFRYGQTETVRVFRFYMDTLACSNSMDAYILSLQNHKISLFV